VLNHDEDIENDGEETESEFSRVPEDRGPVVWKIIEIINCYLHSLLV